MMMSDLPLDLLEEILSTVRWYAIFKDQNFTEKHFHKAAKPGSCVEGIYIGFVENSIYLKFLIATVCCCAPSTTTRARGLDSMFGESLVDPTQKWLHECSRRRPQIC
ncbi:F-box-like domain superfamily [Arabidopsis thaliana x Arabidopsis arenosa]|uniref:F-box-like domain superfamily n=1 Tax=Arabidopsis thaliana x Arabidopsis arenosa TaxID=1240361 RepID=A0A8T2AEM9_9BRAS|nr:F-box-like domain superfamily [Arabidopsis thaliana x Arabidopsis arenosa]